MESGDTLCSLLCGKVLFLPTTCLGWPPFLLRTFRVPLVVRTFCTSVVKLMVGGLVAELAAVWVQRECSVTAPVMALVPEVGQQLSG